MARESEFLVAILRDGASRLLRACEAIPAFGVKGQRLRMPDDPRRVEATSVCHAALAMRRWPCRMLLARANILSTAWTLRQPRTTNWRRFHCRSRALMHSPMVRRL